MRISKLSKCNKTRQNIWDSVYIYIYINHPGRRRLNWRSCYHYPVASSCLSPVCWVAVINSTTLLHTAYYTTALQLRSKHNLRLLQTKFVPAWRGTVVDRGTVVPWPVLSFRQKNPLHPKHCRSGETLLKTWATGFNWPRLKCQNVLDTSHTNAGVKYLRKKTYMIDDDKHHRTSQSREVSIVPNNLWNNWCWKYLETVSWGLFGRAVSPVSHDTICMPTWRQWTVWFVWRAEITSVEIRCRLVVSHI